MNAALQVYCSKHPRFRAKRKSGTDCKSCILLYILRYQHESEADARLGSTNVYQFLDGDIEDVASALRVRAGESIPRETLEIHCTDHSAYRANVRKKNKRSCDACFLLYILRHLHDPETFWKVDGPNIFHFLSSGDVETVAAPLRIRPV